MASKRNIASYFKPLLESSLKFSNNILLPEISIEPKNGHNNTSDCNKAFYSSRDFKFPEKQFGNEPFTRLHKVKWFEIYP